MKLKYLFFSFALAIMFAPVSFASAWFSDVVPGIDVYSTDSASGNFTTVQSTCLALGDDVRVPTIAELNLMYSNEASLGTFVDADYWSATSSSVDNAFQVSFLTGAISETVKTESDLVRCVKDEDVYITADLTAVGTEASNMLAEYFPALLLIFAMLFALAVFRKQVWIWLGR